MKSHSTILQFETDHDWKDRVNSVVGDKARVVQCGTLGVQECLDQNMVAPRDVHAVVTDGLEEFGAPGNWLSKVQETKRLRLNARIVVLTGSEEVYDAVLDSEGSDISAVMKKTAGDNWLLESALGLRDL